jgi:hypothetical protein
VRVRLNTEAAGMMADPSSCASSAARMIRSSAYGHYALAPAAARCLIVSDEGRGWGCSEGNAGMDAMRDEMEGDGDHQRVTACVWLVYRTVVSIVWGMTGKRLPLCGCDFQFQG